MSPFEYVSVLISLILGLGITLILSGIARLIKHSSELRIFWPYLIWIGLVFVLHLHEWWEVYYLRTRTSWNLPIFLFVVLYPILLFILANLLFPLKWSKEIDLKEFYFRICGKFFFFVVCLSIVSILQNLSLYNLSLLEQPVQLSVLVTFSTLLFWKTQKVAIHTIVAIVFLVVLIGSLIFTSETLIIQ